jgi:Dolichyl-phosphate-mannose-protein mannosyltransferase
LPAESGFVGVAVPTAEVMYGDLSGLEGSPVVSTMSRVALAPREADTQPIAIYRLEAKLGEIRSDDQRGTRRPFPVSVPLLTVLALQTVLSLRLVWSKTAFNDEALYLWAGHLELAHLLHGAPVPEFQTYFSGVPVIYPPLAALADSLGGLAAARLLSLMFMLGATVLVYGTTRQLFGRRAGEIAAGSFGLLGSVQFLGAFATYDAMALFLLALATYLVVMARQWLSEPLLIAAGLVLAFADATKYPTTLWDPVVISLAALTATRGGWLRRCSRAVRLALYTSAAIAAALLRFGGRSYLQGILFTTLERGSSRVPAGSILRESALWVGLILVIALRGLVIAENTRVRLICATLAGAVVLAPLEQARIHTQTSLDKHVAFGAWFGAIAVGYVLARAVETSKYMGWRIPVATVGLIALMGIPQASSFYSSWPNAAAVVAEMQRLAASDPKAPIFAEQGPVMDYYLGLPPRQLTNNAGGFWYWDPQRHKEVNGTAAYLEAIRNHYFSIIELDFSFSSREQVDQEVLAALHTAGGYHLVTTIPWTDRFGSADFDLWEYQR